MMNTVAVIMDGIDNTENCATPSRSVQCTLASSSLVENKICIDAERSAERLVQEVCRELHQLVKSSSEWSSVGSPKVISEGHGWVNKSYKVDLVGDNKQNERSGNKSIVVRITSAPADHIKRQYSTLAWLNALQLRVPSPCHHMLKSSQLMDNSGIFRSGDTEQSAMLLLFLPGSHNLFHQRKPHQVTSVARFLGQLHRLTSTCTVRYDRDEEVPSVERASLAAWFSNRHMLDSIDALPSQVRALSELQWVESYWQNAPILDANTENELPQALLHRDLHDENVLFLDSNSESIGVLDWDDSAVGVCLWDLAQTIVFWCGRASSAPTVAKHWYDFEYQLDVEAVNHVLSVYQHTRGRVLSELEARMLPRYVHLTSLWQLDFILDTISSNCNSDKLETLYETLHDELKLIQYYQVIAPAASAHLKTFSINKITP